jgi:hypothetical protein
MMYKDRLRTDVRKKSQKKDSHTHTHTHTQRGGEAIANAVFGASDEFGKLSYSIYTQAYYDKISPLDFSMRPNGTDNPGRT